MNTIKVKNIAELKTRKGTPETVVEVLGYVTEGDGGGGNFYWDNTSTTTEDGGLVFSVSTVSVGRWKRIYEREVVLKWFNVIGDGVTDDTTNFQKAIDTVSTGASIILDSKANYKVSSLNVTGKVLTFVGNNCKITSTGENGAFYKTDHDNKLTVKNINFLGKIGIYHNSSPSETAYDELLIEECSFNVNSTYYGIKLIGTREPIILKCFFRNVNSGNGIYFKDVVSPFVNLCLFKGGGYVGRAIYYPGTGNGTDAGLIIRDTEIMGWDKGLEVVGCDWLNIEGSTIDYNNYSIKLGSQDGANISGNYIGSLGANPALWITSDAAASSPNYCDKITIINNTFTGHWVTDNTYDCILIDGAVYSDQLNITDNSFTFYTRNGIRFSTNAKLSILNNSFAQRSGFGVAPIYNVLGTSDSGVTIKNNVFINATTITALNVTFAKVNENIGCITENNGQYFAGSGVSTYSITHGLSYTPAAKDIQFSCANLECASRTPYLISTDATSIVVGFATATTAVTSGMWRVRRG